MANQIPLSGATNAAGGYLLPPEQGEILVNGILVETGAIQIAGDARSTTARKTNFPIWLGRPTAGPVGEGAAKGVTGASFGQASLNIQKFASIVIFTDEQIADLQNGDLSVLVDAGVRQALSVSIDAHAVGLTAGSILAKGATNAGSVFDSPLLAQGAPGVLIESTKETGVQEAVSTALGRLEENGYGNPADCGVLLGFGFQKVLRDARDGFKRPLYDGGTFAGQTIDALYGLDRAHTTNLVSLGASALSLEVVKAAAKATELTIKTRGTAPLFVGQPIESAKSGKGLVIKALTGNSEEETKITLGKVVNGAIVAAELEAEAVEGESFKLARPVGVVAHKPNIHVRVRQDVVLSHSNEASIVNEGTTYNLFQENLTAVRYETRLGYLTHDGARALSPLYIF